MNNGLDLRHLIIFAVIIAVSGVGERVFHVLRPAATNPATATPITAINLASLQRNQDRQERLLEQLRIRIRKLEVAMPVSPKR